MRLDVDPLPLDANERLQAVAHILANGVLRLRDRQALCLPATAPINTENPADSGQNRLELVAATVLSGATRVDALRDPERRN